jgi:hypothetical protein
MSVNCFKNYTLLKNSTRADTKYIDSKYIDSKYIDSKLEFLDEDNPQDNPQDKNLDLVKIINTKNIDNFDFNKSKIASCIIEGIDLKKLNFKNVLKEIYKKIDDKYAIINNSKLDTILGKSKKFSGYTYIKKLEISVCFTNNKNNIMQEIMHQVIAHNIHIKLHIDVKQNQSI